ncbi:hypothetical protein [Proteiniclasticum ruminis]|uniref:Uncharacterized protein n=1 Tax=Proteiniclasticum ruminis TaxID=398199 RepID=A0A1I5A2B2_9CLOT|nr:hypothetical protein [Proteiniclasticum ruminis]SFN56503.1 hypothetical protein SAMN04488695_102281 [Proteiniclasticum ruminis]
MDKKNKGQILVIVGALLLLLVNNFSLRHKLSDLQLELQNIRGSISAISFNDGGMEYRIMEELKKGASALASSETKLSFKNGKLMLDVTLVPKMLQPGSTYYVVSGYDKVEARAQNGTSFVASLPFDVAENNQVYAVIETEEGALQEKLPEIYVDQYFAIDIRSMSLEETDKKIVMDLTAVTEESAVFLESLNEVSAVVLNEKNEETDRLEMKETDVVLPDSEHDYGFAHKAFTVSLPEELYEMDLFKVVVELKNYGVTMISDEVYQYSSDGTEMNGVMGAGFRISFEE